MQVHMQIEGQLCTCAHSMGRYTYRYLHAQWGRGRFTLVSMWNRLYSLLFIYLSLYSFQYKQLLTYFCNTLYVNFIYIHIYTGQHIVQKVSSRVKWKIETFFWRRYKLQETLYTGQGCLSPLQRRHLGTSHSSLNRHQLPRRIFLNFIHGLKSLRFQRWF